MQFHLLPLRRFHQPEHIRELFLCLFWIAGLPIGYLFVGQLSETYYSLMRMAVKTPVSIVGLMTVIFLPLLLSVVALAFSKPLLFVPLAFLKSFLYSFTVSAVMFVFNDAGWLVAGLLLFSESLMNVLLLWFWFRNLHRNHTFFKDVMISTFIAAAVFVIDFYAVSPFLVSLFYH